MTTKLDMSLGEYENGGGDSKFIQDVAGGLDINTSKIQIIEKRSGSVYLTFQVISDEGQAYLSGLHSQINNLLMSSDFGYPVVSVTNYQE